MLPLSADGLYRFYHDGDIETAALKGVSLELAAGEFVAVMGPSGSGKSTLLACLAGLDDPDGGVVEVMGQRISRRTERERANLRARHIGILMQSGNLFDHLTLACNLSLQLKLAGLHERSGIDDLLQTLGLTQRLQARPSQLSGGELARAGLALALCTRPALLLADEPTAEVDSLTEANILDCLKVRCREHCAILIATHSHALASQADRLLTLDDGRLVNDPASH
ncbi:ABC transporter ATP-binding protein [Pseudomonas akapageensis]|uniref:ABC transporter ATP-binding protein n=1 Tax=Pseudomonas akapageensis TaxID=2609961 RepID=UPI00140A0593|nr:ABC transporter ATP-binding protein [Pseudomonas akapageensis]